MIIPRVPAWLLRLLAATGIMARTAAASAQEADLILHHGKVVTVDREFTISQALAVKGDRLDPGGNRPGSDGDARARARR